MLMIFRLSFKILDLKSINCKISVHVIFYELIEENYLKLKWINWRNNR